MWVGMPLEVIPALLASSNKELEAQLQRVKPYFKRVQIDVVDGLFAPNVSASPEAVSLPKELKIDLHLMVNQPEDYLARCVDLKLNRIISQVEPLKDQEVFLRRVKKIGSKPGLALDLETSVESLEMAFLGEVDYVLVMGVKAGFSGQQFQPAALEKISLLDRQRKANQGFNYRIGVDGGVNPRTIKAIKQAGADEVLVTSYLLKSASIKEALEELRR